MEQMRAEFEEWFDKECGYCANFSGREEIFKQAFWQVWQASRAALEVELPASVYRANEYHIEYTGEVVKEYDEYYEIEDIKNALEQAGVKFK